MSDLRQLQYNKQDGLGAELPCPDSETFSISPIVRHDSTGSRLILVIAKKIFHLTLLVLQPEDVELSDLASELQSTQCQ